MNKRVSPVAVQNCGCLGNGCSSDLARIRFRLTEHCVKPCVCVFSAPEILRGNAYGPEVDMWSVGVILYIL